MYWLKINNFFRYVRIIKGINLLNIINEWKVHTILWVALWIKGKITMKLNRQRKTKLYFWNNPLLETKLSVFIFLVSTTTCLLLKNYSYLALCRQWPFMYLNIYFYVEIVLLVNINDSHTYSAKMVKLSCNYRFFLFFYFTH